MPKTVIIPAALLLIAVLFIAGMLASTVFGMTHDDGIYLVTAKALAEGKGYRILSLPGSPAQTKYPILFPLLLSFLWRINPHFPENGYLLKAVPAAAMAGWLIVCYRFLRRYASLPRHAAFWILFFVAVNQWTLFTAGTLMSEALFSLFTLAAIAMLAHATRRSAPVTQLAKGSMWSVVAAALLVAAAYHTRTAALPLAAAGGLALAARKRYRDAAVFCGIAMFFVLPWLFWQRQAADLGTLAENYYTAKNYGSLNLLTGQYPFKTAAHIFAKNLYFFAGYPASWIFCLSFPDSLRHTYALTGILFWLLVLRGMLRAPPWFLAAQIFTVLYVAMLLLYVWSPERFLLPLVPLLLLFAYFALPRRTPAWVVPALAILPLLLAYNEVRTTRTNHTASMKALPWIYSDPAPSWRDVSPINNWIRNHAAPEAVVLADFDPTLYLYSGHRAIRVSPFSGPDLFYGQHRPLPQKLSESLAIMQKYRPQYLIDTCCDPAPLDYLIQYLGSVGRLDLLYQGSPPNRIFRILPARAVSSASLPAGNR